VSKRKKDLRILLPLSLKFKQRRSQKETEMKVASKQRDLIHLKAEPDEQVSNKLCGLINVSISLNTQIPDKRQVEVGPSRHNEEVQEPDLEQVYTTGSLGNTLTWGDQQIPKPVDEVADIYVISYDRKRKAIVQRTAKKRRITLDHSILITTEENLINTADAQMSELIGVGKALSDATLDRSQKR
jgi:hypothetical protein